MPKILKENDYFETSDLALAATLLCFGYYIEAIERKNSSKAAFLFRRDKDLDEIVQNFWRGEVRVEPQRFFNALRMVKARLYGER